MRLSKLAEEMDVKYIGGDVEFTALNIDSRNKVKNGLFICLKGKNVDSHNHAAEAVRRGAVAVVSERELNISVPQIIVEDTRAALGKIASFFYGQPAKRLKIIGVTGTNGKTTTTYMLASIFRAAGKKTGVIGTLGVTYDKKRLPPSLTTPDPIELN